MRYRINTPKVIHQVFDSEVVIINLESGIYYSLRGSGVDLWQAIDAGISPEALTTQFNGTAAPEKIFSFLRQLESEELILPMNGESSAETTPLPSRKPFSEPVFDKFTDMREMLLIDPIHELDENGWPKRGRAHDQQ